MPWRRRGILAVCAIGVGVVVEAEALVLGRTSGGVAWA